MLRKENRQTRNCLVLEFVASRSQFISCHRGREFIRAALQLYWISWWWVPLLSFNPQIFFPLIPPLKWGTPHRTGLRLMKIIQLDAASDEDSIGFSRCLILICSRLRANDGFEAPWWNTIFVSMFSWQGWLRTYIWRDTPSSTTACSNRVSAGHWNRQAVLHFVLQTSFLTATK